MQPKRPAATKCWSVPPSSRAMRTLRIDLFMRSTIESWKGFSQSERLAGIAPPTYHLEVGASNSAHEICLERLPSMRQVEVSRVIRALRGHAQINRHCRGKLWKQRLNSCLN